MISVAMATYNGENYISEQIDSIINQTRKVDEIVIVDDHSTDQTVPILLHLQKDHPEWNIKIHVSTKNVGYKTNFKNAIELTSGDLVFLCDQDDIWHKDKVE
ncbi:glycosyltransferase, partial [Dubosiella newyorkensis]